MSKFTTQAEERRTVALKAAAEVHRGVVERPSAGTAISVLTVASYFETYLSKGQIGLDRPGDDEDDNADG